MNAVPTFAEMSFLSARDFNRLADYIEQHSGIKMPPNKKTMVEGRLRKRVKALGVANLTEYCRRIFDEGGLPDESIYLIDEITTNKTEFFREAVQFQFLTEIAMPTLLAERIARREIKVWSAASSIGAEPYTLAMVMDDFCARHRSLRYSIAATDIATKVLKVAAEGVYSADMADPVPVAFRRRYLMQGKGNAQGLVRVVPELRVKVRFRHLNLMDNSYPLDQDMDIIFCRNILIYFERATQQAVLSRLCDHLKPGGYLFLGHSESLNGLNLPVESIGKAVFRRL